METHEQELEQRHLDVLAESYRARGYEVEEQPLIEVPGTSASYQADLVARSDAETVVIEVTTPARLAGSPHVRELARAIRPLPGWRFELALLPRTDALEGVAGATPVSPPEALLLIDEARNLLQQGFVEASILRGWAAAEVLLRALTQKGDSGTYPNPSRMLIELAADAFIGREDYRILKEWMAARNAMAHGYKASGIDPGAAQRYLSVAQRLAQGAAPEPA